MAINVYCGLQGSGKSYESVSGPIMEAILHGRTVVTNIDGINEGLIHEHLIKVKKADQAKLGKIVHVDNARVTEPLFFPDEEHPENVTVVKGGDLVALDECWRFWPEGSKLSDEHMQFFRMHRHYVDAATGVTCDLVLMTQDITGLARSVKNVVEFSFKMHKMKSLGQPKRYRVELYEGWKQNAKTRVDTYIKKYDPAIFPLYKSYAAGNGKEKEIDKRQNVLANPRILVIGAGMLLMLCTSIGYLVWFWNSKSKAEQLKVEQTKEKQTAQQSPQVVTSSGPVSSGPVSTLRVAGQLTAKGQRWVVLVDQNGMTRLENPAAFVGQGSTVVGTIEGQRVATWTGKAGGGK